VPHPKETPLSNYRGVTYASKQKAWKAQISRDGKVSHLGYYHNEREAALVYDEAALAHRGVNAKTNFPRKGVV